MNDAKEWLDKILDFKDSITRPKIMARRSKKQFETTDEYLKLLMRDKCFLLARSIDHARSWIKNNDLSSSQFLFVANVQAFASIDKKANIYFIAGWQDRKDIVDIRRAIMSKECQLVPSSNLVKRFRNIHQ